MEVIKTAIDGVLILEPRIFKDARGYFFESFSSREVEEKWCKTTFVQDNESFSGYGVVRGLHFQKPPFTQSKIVRVIKGSVLDVAVDIRKGSPRKEDMRWARFQESLLTLLLSHQIIQDLKSRRQL